MNYVISWESPWFKGPHFTENIPTSPAWMREAALGPARVKGGDPWRCDYNAAEGPIAVESLASKRCRKSLEVSINGDSLLIDGL